MNILTRAIVTASALLAIAVPSANAHHRRYPAQIEQNFINACVANSLGNVRSCRCLLTRIEHTITLRDFLAYEQALVGGGKPNLRTAARLRAAIAYCA
jgi:hypothetical protein